MASLQEELDRIERQALEQSQAAVDTAALEKVRVGLLGKKGALTSVLRGVSSLPADQRPRVGLAANLTKARVEEALSRRTEELASGQRRAALGGPQLDVTLPAFGQPPGHRHPLSTTMEEVCEVLCDMGFSIVEGPDVEDDHHNFEALNIPADHPARDMQDTFFVEGGYLLRTHTSPVQIRTMEVEDPPIMIIAPGSVYRIDDDATHSPMFHQVEGLMVDRGINFGHLKAVLTGFLQRIFEPDVPVRFRPSYFPFTEPSAEVDIACVMCRGRDGRPEGSCRMCRGSGWLEILGCGMVHPAVFEKVGYDAEVYSGFAFGLGIERIAMLRHGIDDIRLFYGGDLRFLSQF